MKSFGIAKWNENKNFLLFAVIYILIVRGSLAFIIQPGGLVLIWPPSGIALAMLILYRRQYWKIILAIIFIQNAVANLWSGNTFLLSAEFAFANTLEPLLGAWVITTIKKDGITFTTLKEVIYLLFVATAANAVTALVGAAFPSLAFGTSFWGEYLSWWVPEGLGILLFTPFVITWSNTSNIDKNFIIKNLPEEILSAILLVGVAAYIFVIQSAENLLISGYVVFPILLWIAFRFTPKGSSAASLVLSVIVLWGAAFNRGMFALPNQTLRDNILAAQLFLSVVCFSSAVLAAIIAERKIIVKNQVDQFKRISKHERTLVELATKKIPLSTNLNKAVITITEFAASATDVDSVSVWLIKGNNGSLALIDKYERLTKEHSAGVILEREACPNYLSALFNKRIIDASDISKNSDLSDLLKDILIPQKIISRLDATIINSGNTVGVVCFEHSGTTGRHWQADELIFAREIADLVTQLLINTERLETENALRKSEENYRNIINFAPVGFFISSLDGTITLTNDRYAGILGYNNASEILNFNFERDIYFNPDERKKNLSILIEKNELRNLEILVKRKDGSAIWTANDIRLIKDKNGSQQYVEGFVRDIDAAKNAQDELIKLSRAVEQSPSSVLITDLNGNIEYVNQKFVELTGYSFEEVKGKNPRILKSGKASDEFYKNMWSTITSGKTWQGELFNKKKNGEFFWENAFISPIVDSNGILKYFLAVKEDISEKKRIIEELKSVQESFALAVEGSSDGLWDWIIPSNKVYYSPQWKHLLGFKDSELQNNMATLIERVHPNEKEKVWQYLKNYLERGEVFNTEMRIRKKDSSYGWYRLRGKAVRDENGKALRFSGSMTDITLRRENEEKYRLLMENLNEAVMQVDNDDKVIFVNKRFTELLGYLPEEIIGNIGNSVLMKEADRHLILKANAERIEGKKSQYEVRFYSKDGNAIDFLINGSPIYDDDGNVIGSLGAMTDITQRKNAEHKLFESEERFRALIENTSDIIFILDETANKVLYSSNAVERVLGYTVNELIGTSGKIVIHPDDQQTVIQAHSFTLQNPGESIFVEYRIKHKDGSWRTFEAIGKNLLHMSSVGGVVVNLRDISERKIAEQKLKNNENLFKIITSGVSDLIAIVDLEGKRIYASDSYTKIFGDESLAYGRDSFAEIHPDDRDAIREVFKKTLEDRKARRAEFRFRLNDGSIRNIESQGNIIFDEKGNPFRIVIVSRDITEYKRTESELRANQQLLSSINKNINEAIYRITISNSLLYINEAFAKMFGYSTIEEAINADSPLLFADHTHKEVLESELVKSGSLHNLEVKLRRKDGTAFWGLLNAKEVTDEKGNSLYYDGAISDITYLKETEAKILELNKGLEEKIELRTIELKKVNENLKLQEESLKISEQQYRLVIESAHDAIIVAQDGKIKFANPRAIGITGFSMEELLAKNFLDFIHDEDKKIVLDNYLRRMKGEELPANYSFRIICNDGSQRVVEINAVLVNWQGRVATLNFLTDVTERKQAEEEIRKSLEIEKELNELRSRFISMASHEFRTPLTTIFSAAEIMEKFSHKMNDEQKKKNLLRIQENVNHMTQLLNDVLIIGKAEAHKLELRREKIDLHELCLNVIEQFEMSTIPKTGHKILFSFNSSVKYVSLDPKLVRQILENLISNAIKYSSNGSDVILTVENNAEMLFLTIKDFGIGIPENDLKNMYVPFHRAENVGTISGTGLGLTIIKNSVEIHGGTISCESKQNIGTTFKIQLPLIVS